MNKIKEYELKEGQYLINGKILSEIEVINYLFEWARNNFIFRNNDVYLPYAPKQPLMGLESLIRHKELDVEAFIVKFGSVSLKYLIYNIFMAGYDAGLAKADQDSNLKVKDILTELADTSISKDKEAPLNKKETDKVNEIVDYFIGEDKPIRTEEEENIIEKIEAAAMDKVKLEEDFMNPPIDKEIDIVEKVLSEESNKELIEANDKIAYLPSGALLISSKKYLAGTYEKYISTIIEDTLLKSGMTVGDMEDPKFPTYYLGEVLKAIEEADTISNEQKKVKTVFYDYIKDIHEKATKEQTTT